jgi:RNA polymerase sigma-70 factor (ECF subfamily)
MSSKNIQELAENFITSSSEKDFKKLYDRLKPGLLNHCRAILVDEEISEDAVSKTFEKIWTKIEQYDSDRGNFSTWAYNIARNESLLIKKNSARYTPLVYESVNITDDNGEGGQGGLFRGDHIELTPSIAESFSDPDWSQESIEQQMDELYTDVVEKIKGLPEIYKEILIDRELNKMKYQDIATKHGMKKRAVATRIRRARIKVREMFPNVNLVFNMDDEGTFIPRSSKNCD